MPVFGLVGLDHKVAFIDDLFDVLVDVVVAEVLGTCNFLGSDGVGALVLQVQVLELFGEDSLFSSLQILLRAHSFQLCFGDVGKGGVREVL